MTPAQRQSAFDRFFASLARARAQRLGLRYAGTIRKLPPPPLPGETTGATRYYLNAVAADGSASGLVELGRSADAALRKAERWVETGKGPAPVPAGKRERPATLKRKV
ncbi:MAG TPA: hypothetical protein VN775_02540 [Opitutaceae bacterium]|nr:hypothetical protein [Opitutaceae bacterium]